MSITFNTNIAALGTQRYLGIASDNTQSSLEKLSSGSRVPEAKDDAAALAVGTQLKAQVAGLQQASLNASQATSVLQIADGALSTTSDILTRMSTLAVQASSGQLSDSDRSLLDQEYQSLLTEVDRIAGVTNFNGETLLSGSTQMNTQVNNLAAFSTDNPNTAAVNLLTSNNGVQGISFANTFNGAATGAISLSYSHTTNNLTATNLVTGATQSINIGSTAIPTGTTSTFNFSSLGLSVTLNQQFNHAADLAGTNTTGSTAAASATAYTLTPSTTNLGLTGVTATVASITAIAFTGTGANQIDGSALAGAVSAIGGATDAAVSMGNITIGGHVFTSSSTGNFTTTGAHSYAFSDGQGNTFSVNLNTTGAATGGSPAGNITFSAGTTGGLVEADATSRPSILAVTESGTVANQFNFGNLDDAQISLSATATPSAGTASISINGVSFTATGINLSTTGAKTATLTDANGNSIKVGFTVTQAFAANDTAHLNMASFGQVAGANAQTTGSTTFSFKVGTGTSVNDNVSFTLTAAGTAALGINGTSIGTATNANSAITAVDAAITTVSSDRAAIGASESRLGFAKSSVDIAVQNTTAAESGLLDVDVSSEITNFSSQQVLLQAGVSLLAQANQQPALLLKLLQ